MTTFKRICVKDFEIIAANGDHFEIRRGKEYLTGPEHDGKVTVFTAFWVKVPIEHFAGEIQFT